FTFLPSYCTILNFILIKLRSTCLVSLIFFFFNDTATSEIYTLSLHDALPICAAGCIGTRAAGRDLHVYAVAPHQRSGGVGYPARDRKSTRLNSSHLGISYAVFCLKKKKKRKNFNQTSIGTYTS